MYFVQHPIEEVQGNWNRRVIMPTIKWRAIVVAILILILIARARQIAKFFAKLNVGEIITLEPLQNSPQEGKFLVTLGLFALAFVTIFCLLNKRK